MKEKDAGKPLGPVIEKMNELVQKYYDRSRPLYCAQHGYVDEVVRFPDLRRYLEAFAGGAYQNPTLHLCPAPDDPAPDHPGLRSGRAPLSRPSVTRTRPGFSRAGPLAQRRQRARRRGPPSLCPGRSPGAGGPP